MKETYSSSTPPQFNKFVTIVLAFLVLVFASLSAFLAFRSGLIYTLLIKVGVMEDVAVNKDSYKAWANCLEQLDIDADIVFIGDSITANGDFQSLIHDKTVCNLGCYGDQIWDVTARIGAVRAVHPETVCIMVGTNTLACRSLDQAIRSYSVMADTYSSSFPECKIILLSILPVAHELESGARTNENIRKFNAFVQDTAIKHNAKYIDLYSIYQLDGILNHYYTEDGLHIVHDSYSLWVDTIQPFL